MGGLSSVWNDNFLSPIDPVGDNRQQNQQLSLGALDNNAWDGLTFASSITNSDRDSLSPDYHPTAQQTTYKHSDIVSFFVLYFPATYNFLIFIFSRKEPEKLRY